MPPQAPPQAPVRGLEGIVAADTNLSYVDGKNGKLYYRGYDINEIATRVCFTEAVHLLWFGELPNARDLKTLQAEFVGAMSLPAQVLELLQLSPPNANPMVVLRTAISALSMFDPDGGDNSPAANLRKAKRVLAQVATIVAAQHRIWQGDEVLYANPRLTFADNILYMFRGTEPSDIERDVVDTLLVLHADHGMAASTFTARVSASTEAGIHSAITAALASLKGPLHGGANVRVMEMLEQIDDPEGVEEYIDTMLSSGRRIMGFGHRMYKVEDPRSHHLREMAHRLAQGKPEVAPLIEISQRIEQVVRERKGIYPNVDFYSAIVQKALGIPKEFYTCIFALARTAGWIAHVFEQHIDNRLIRPTSNYQGGFGKKYVPVGQR